MHFRRQIVSLLPPPIRIPLARLVGRGPDLLVGPVPRPPWAPAGNPRDSLSRQFIRGHGIEIGALNCPLFVPRGVQVTYIDRWDTTTLREQLRDHHDYSRRPLVPVDRVDDGETLATLPTESQDFVIANHFIEHVPDPIRTIRRHLDVLRPEGILFLAVPDRRWTFDRKRQVTSLEHLHRDYEEGPEWSFLDHVREWAELVENRTGSDLEARIAALAAQGRPNIHYHVWTLHQLMELLPHLRKRLALGIDIEAVVHNQFMGEAIAVLRRTR
ncbi:MAG: class I SAM-dependent methyltransferase [Gemmataceae bacterium]|nr:class I SAM-dependent methyltransferase [Gemmataceae bacterium]